MQRGGLKMSTENVMIIIIVILIVIIVIHFLMKSNVENFDNKIGINECRFVKDLDKCENYRLYGTKDKPGKSCKRGSNQCVVSS